MTYFTNGTDAEIYESHFCNRCANQKDNDEGCPIWNLHFDHNGEEDWRATLDAFIPDEPAPEWHGECKCFVPVNMKPDRTYVPPTPEAYRLLFEAEYELRDAINSVAEVADEQLAEVQTHYEPEHVCDKTCASAPMAVWLSSMGAEQTAARIRKFLADKVVSA